MEKGVCALPLLVSQSKITVTYTVSNENHDEEEQVLTGFLALLTVANPDPILMLYSMLEKMLCSSDGRLWRLADLISL